MAVWYAGFCPEGDLCSKKGRRVCLCESIPEVHEKIAWHLHSSTYHNHALEDAQNLASTCEILEEVYDGNDMSSDGTNFDSKGKGKQKSYDAKGSEGNQGPRSDFKGKASDGKGGKGYDRGWLAGPRSSTSRAAPYEMVARAPPIIQQPEVHAALAAISRCEAAARTAARMARAAALAFEEEGSIMTSAIGKLQRMLENQGDA